MEDPVNRKIFVDLDGVLVDWDGGFQKISGGLTGNDYEQKFSRVAAMDLVKQYGVPWWANLEWMKDGKELWQYLNENFLNIKILTATGRPGGYTSQAKRGKVEWMKNNLIGLPDSNKIIVGRKLEKSQYANSGDILIDDNEENIQDWNNAGGIGILHKNTASTISKLKNYL